MSLTVELLFVVSTLSFLVSGRLVALPENRVAVVGESIQLRCSTDQNYSVKWQHIPFGSKSAQDVFISRTVVAPYNERFHVVMEEIQGNLFEYQLVITSVQKQDSGIYRCHDKAGQGQVESAELTLIESAPICSSNINEEGFIGENDCEVPIEFIHCSCTLEYIGNIAPEIFWKTSEGKYLQAVSKRQISAFSITSELHVNATLQMNGKTIISYPINSLRYRWTSNPIKIHYANANRSIVMAKEEDVITCLAKSSGSCRYKWFARDISKFEWTGSEVQVLRIDRSGEYRCEGICPLRNTNCIVNVMNVEVKHQDDQDETSEWYMFASISAMVVCGVVFLVLQLIATVLRMRSRHNTNEKEVIESNTLVRNPPA